MSGVAVASSLVARDRKYVVVLLLLARPNVSAVGLIVRRGRHRRRRSAVVRGGCRLLAALVHRKHGTTVRGGSNLGRLYVDLYLLARSLILIVVDGVTDVAREIVLSVLARLRARSAEGPGVSAESRGGVARSGAHIRALLAKVTSAV